ncbi:MFS transporter [Consotaella aegiceratis]|uniref:MFS transporter n=1 Tax=Consotaella aegiceratis TaxID=3097961 RepID=UPI002F3E6ADB
MPIERVAVSSAFLANGFYVGSWAPQIPLLADRLDISNAVLGLVVLVFGLGAVGTMPIVGALIARLGSRRIMIGTGVLLAIALPILAWAPTLAWAFPAGLFAGGMTGSMDVAMNANAVALERRLPFAIMSSCHGFWSLGGLLGAAVGGIGIATLGGEGHALAVGALILATIVLLVPRALEDRRETPKPATDEEPHHETEAANAPLSLSRSLLMVVAIGIFALCAMIPEGAVLDWGAIYLRDDLGAGVAISGFGFAAFSLTMAAFRFAGDGLRDRFGAVRTTQLSALAAALGLCTAALSGSVVAACFGFAVMGIGIANMVPIAFSAAGNVPGLRPGIGLSIVSTLGYSGILLAPSAIGFMAERVGFPPIFLTLSILLLAAFASARLLKIADRPQ